VRAYIFFGTCWSCFLEMAPEYLDIVLNCAPPPKYSVECCERPDIVLSIVNLWKSDPFWVGALQKCRLQRRCRGFWKNVVFNVW